MMPLIPFSAALFVFIIMALLASSKILLWAVFLYIKSMIGLVSLVFHWWGLNMQGLMHHRKHDVFNCSWKASGLAI